MSQKWTLVLALSLGLGLVACNGDDPPTDQPVDQPVEPVETHKLPDISPEELRAKAENTALVPSPAEMQKALEAAGITTELAAKVPDRSLKMDVPNKDQVAVRTGVILADLLLTVKGAEKEKLGKHLGDIKQGMAELGAGSDIGATIDDLDARIQNDSVSRDDLVKELDELSGAIIPEIEYEAGERSVPLIQAGSWLEGANLVAAALIESGNFESATTLLKQPAVVSYFQSYVKTEGQDKAPSEVIAQLETTLATLAEICSHETFGEEEVKTIHASTSAVLDLL